jgi:hypothetical protein
MSGLDSGASKPWKKSYASTRKDAESSLRQGMCRVALDRARPRRRLLACVSSFSGRVKWRGGELSWKRVRAPRWGRPRVDCRSMAKSVMRGTVERASFWRTSDSVTHFFTASDTRLWWSFTHPWDASWNGSACSWAARSRPAWNSSDISIQVSQSNKIR